MFLFGKKEANSFNSLPFNSLPDYKIVMFGRQFKIKVDTEIEEPMDIPPDFTSQMFNMLISRMNEVESSIKMYVLSNYREIIENYYLYVSYPSKRSAEYKEHLSVINDYENNTKNHIDIILKNIQPICFSISNKEPSYLFLYVNDVDEFGIDVDLLPQIVFHKHDED